MNEVRVPEASPAGLRAVFDAQARFFEAGSSRSEPARRQALAALAASIRRHEKHIADALWADLHKPEFEAYGTETSMVLHEVRHAERHLARWMRPRSWLPGLVSQPARSRLYADPLGRNLIIGAWNYPVQLTLQPLVAALAAGNVAVVKPSELAPAASSVVATVVREALPPEHVAVVEGGVSTSEALLQLPWDHVFFTGSPNIGKVVMRAAAEHLSRVTLELGGKSPCIVMPSANLDTAASRIAWGRFSNAGQTCVAPDYLLVHRDVHEPLLAKIEERVRAFYGPDPKASPDYGRLVTSRHAERVRRLIDPAKVRFGGQVDVDDRYVAPTVLTGVTVDDPVMQEEIFGPVLPVLAIDSLDDAYRIVARNPNPLALYVFTEVPAEAEAVFGRVAFGGGCVNNTMYHLSDPGLPFGGVGRSGQGAYHGKHGFDVFSHHKGVLHSASGRLFDPSFKYPPYEGNLKTLKLLVG